VPTPPIHGFFSASIAGEITKQLKRIAERQDGAGEFAAQIMSWASARILLKEDEGLGASDVPLLRRPDEQFQHERAMYPGVVLEISCSPNRKDLRKRAWDYIQYSNGDIKAVIGFAFNYGEGESTVSLWRPAFVREEGEELDILDVKRIAHQVGHVQRCAG